MNPCCGPLRTLVRGRPLARPRRSTSPAPWTPDGARALHYPQAGLPPRKPPGDTKGAADHVVRAGMLRDYVMGRSDIAPEPFKFQRVDWREQSTKESLYVPAKAPRRKNGTRPSPHMWESSARWRYETASLNARYDRTSTSYLKTPAPPNLRQWEEKIQQISAELDAGADVNTYFRLADGSVHVPSWERMALWTMYNDPARAMRFLHQTVQLDPERQRMHFKTVVRYLIGHFWHSKADDRATQLNKLAALVPRIAISGSTYADEMFFRLIDGCSLPIVEQLYIDVLRYQIPLSWHTWLQFCHRFTYNSRYERALEAVYNASRTGAQPGHLAFAMACSGLLRKAIRESDGLRVCLRLVDHLTKSGLALNVDICNILMLNASDVGDVTTAMSVYRSMTENGVAPTAATFGVLLQAWKTSREDTDLLNNIISDAIAAGQLKQSPVLATEVIYCLMLHHKEHDPRSAFDIVANAYCELFHVGPLQALGILFGRPQEAPDARMEPTSGVMQLMIWAHLNHLLANEVPVQRAHELYARWRQLVLSGTQPYAQMARTPHVANFFMHHFAQTERGLQDVARVLQDLQAPLPEDWPHPEAPPGGPDAHSWTTFVAGFVRHGKAPLAQKVLAYMHEHDIAPVPATYNSLLYGYAGRQDLDGMLATLREMESQDMTWDRYTLRALRQFHDQSRLRRVYAEERNRSPNDKGWASRHLFPPRTEEDLANSSESADRDAYFGDEQRYDADRERQAAAWQPDYTDETPHEMEVPEPADFTNDLQASLSARIEGAEERQLHSAGSAAPAASMPRSKAKTDDEALSLRFDAVMHNAYTAAEDAAASASHFSTASPADEQPDEDAMYYLDLAGTATEEPSDRHKT